MHLFLKSKLLVTARLRSLIMDSEGDLGERGSLEINDRCCWWRGKVQRSILLVPDSSERNHVRDVFEKFMLVGRLFETQRIRTEIEWRLQVFGVFWMHCCELQVHSLTTNRVAEHGNSWGLILFCCKWAKAQEGVTSHWHAFTPAALSSSAALFSWFMIDLHVIFHMVSSCFLEYSMVDMHGIILYMVSSHSHRCICFTIQGFPTTCCHLLEQGGPRPPTWRY